MGIRHSRGDIWRCHKLLLNFERCKIPEEKRELRRLCCEFIDGRPDVLHAKFVKYFAGESLVSCHAKLGHYAATRLLLSRGAKLTQEDGQHIALQAMKKARSPKIIYALHLSGIDITLPLCGINPLTIESLNYIRLEILLQLGCFHKEEGEDPTPLDAAAHSRRHPLQKIQILRAVGYTRFSRSQEMEPDIADALACHIDENAILSIRRNIFFSYNLYHRLIGVLRYT